MSFVGEFEHHTKKVKDAKKTGVLVVSEELLGELDSLKSGDVAALLKKHKLSDWGDVDAAEARVRSLQELQRASAAAAAAKSGGGGGNGAPGKSGGGSKSIGGKSAFTKSMPEKLKVKLKGGVAVEPDSGLEDAAHVLKEGDTVWNAVLGLVDLVRGTNAFYKLQLLQSDDSASRCVQFLFFVLFCFCCFLLFFLLFFFVVLFFGFVFWLLSGYMINGYKDLASILIYSIYFYGVSKII